MWIVEAIPLANANQNKAAVEAAIRQEVSRLPNPPHLVWRLFIYQNPDDRFKVNGTLHQHNSAYSAGGIYTVTLDAGDVYVNLSEFDGEVLQLGYRNGEVLEGIETLGSGGTPILPYYPQHTHTWLEALGGEYHLGPNPVVVTNQGQSPQRLTITLQ
jgi:hypothetical protein